VIWTSSLVDSTESDAVRRSTYAPGAENDAVVDNAEAFPNVTVPGPDTRDHVVVTAAGGFGRPSSDALPDNDAVAGNVTDWSVPAFTTGAWFTGVLELTVIWISSLADNDESDAVRRSTYAPGAENDAVVDNADAFPNVTVPGPDTRDHVVVTAAGGFGRPSSDADPDNDAVAGNVTVSSAPALTVGGWFTGPPPPMEYSTCNTAAPLPKSKPRAVRVPVPATVNATGLPVAHPDWPMISCTIDARFGVR
jgi:hypothetical protein